MRYTNRPNYSFLLDETSLEIKKLLIKWAKDNNIETESLLLKENNLFWNAPMQQIQSYSVELNYEKYSFEDFKNKFLQNDFSRKKNPLLNINYDLLREQKLTILNIINKEEELNISDEEVENLTGIIHLIDAVQDYAVESLGFSENEVFNLTEN